MTKLGTKTDTRKMSVKKASKLKLQNTKKSMTRITLKKLVFPWKLKLQNTKRREASMTRMKLKKKKTISIETKMAKQEKERGINWTQKETMALIQFFLLSFKS